MEILPHFWIGYYKENLLPIIKQKNITNIIHLSKDESFKQKLNIEEIRIFINYNDDNSFEETNNIMYDHLSDITEYIHKKITNNANILLLGYINKQDIDTIIIAYFIKYGKINIRESILFLKSKKNNIFNDKCMFYPALNRFNKKVIAN